MKPFTLFTHQLSSGIALAAILLTGVAFVPSQSLAQGTAASAKSAEKTSTAMNTLSNADKKAGWKLLFDGKTTNGWKSFNKSTATASGWTADNGMLTTKGGNGDIVTTEKYENFELDVEWKVAPKGKSGIFYRVLEGEQYKRTYDTGPEYQLIDDENYPQKLNDKQLTGANYDLDAPLQKGIAKPAGEFNHARIKVKDGHVEHWLNEKKVADYQLESDEWKAKVKGSKFATLKDYGITKKGHIALQDHGDAVWFKNMKIRPL